QPYINRASASRLPVVQLLPKIVDSVKWPSKGHAGSQRIQSLPGIHRASPQRASQATLPIAQSGEECYRLGNQKLGRIAGSQRPEGGQKISQGYVDFMSDR